MMPNSIPRGVPMGGQPVGLGDTRGGGPISRAFSQREAAGQLGIGEAVVMVVMCCGGGRGGVLWWWSW